LRRRSENIGELLKYKVHALARTTIVIPCVQVGRLTRHCISECRRLCNDAEIHVLADVEPQIRMAGTTVTITGSINMAVKRNIAARVAKTEFLAFIDGDACPIGDWLANAERYLDARPDLGAVGGPNLSPVNQDTGERIIGLALRSVFLSGKATYRKVCRPPRLVDDLPSCNLIVRRNMYLMLGGMNEALFVGEDKDFCARLRTAGHHILYTPDVRVHHKNRRPWPFLLQRFTYGSGVPDLLREHINLETLITSAPMVFLLFLLTFPLAFFWQEWLWLYAFVLGVYLAGITMEAVRHAERVTDIPALAVALVAGNLIPGIGTIFGLCRLIPDRKNLYRNDQ
jgi:hypothetical protein